MKLKIQNAFLELKNIVVNDKKTIPNKIPGERHQWNIWRKRGNPDSQDKQETQMRGTKMKGPQIQQAQT